MLTEQQINQINWEKVNQLLPVVVQHALSGKVLMLGYMNQEAFKRTCEEKKVVFYSRTKERLWVKGESSGHFLELKEMFLDCDQDTLLVLAMPQGPTCHLGTTSCFADECSSFSFLYELEQLLKAKKTADPESSYTASLYQRGTKRIAQKVGEEGVEVALAAMTDDQNELINESADLIYHLLVLLQQKDTDFLQVLDCLLKRQINK